DVYELVKKDNYLLTMLDFNHFKAINDEYGHQRGDEALIFFAERLKQELQDFEGHIYRLGGDEFAFLVLEKMPLDREKLFEKIDKELKQFHQLASIAHGTVLITNDTCNEVLKAEHSMAKADQLMYEMKTKYYKANDLVLRKKD
ncbi:MAG: GGDEF domain-containing protein, partial [Bacilli bacterium]|nr:GGDEF domain-containing protein [Bacilli bacterium]